MKKLAIIPARGGSKRIPRKNIKEFIGKPIIAYSIENALNCGVFDEIMVSTDDEEIAQVAKKYGANVPFYRSKELSSDMAMTVPVLFEVLDKYEQFGKTFDYICCLYPCAPFVTPKRLRESMKLLVDSGVDSVLPVVKFSYPPQRCFVLRNEHIVMLYPENYNMRSQDLEPYYHDAGQFYFAQCSSLRREEKFFCEHTLPLVLPETEVQDIDTEEDWKIAEMKYKILGNMEARVQSRSATASP
jgi:N-acylneuraminate cytidylyltransferase